MKRRLRTFRAKARAGTTLTEMAATLLVFSLLMAMVTAVLQPAARIFIRMQKLQYAQIILDNTVQELRGIILEASGDGYVKIYEECGLRADGSAVDLTGRTPDESGAGADRGRGLEFVNPDHYVMLVSADGSPRTDIYVGTAEPEKIGTEEQIKPGRLIMRCYRQKNGRYDYSRTEEGGTVYAARAVSRVFGDSSGQDSSGPVSGYYMGNYLGLEFSFPDSCKEVTDAGGNVHRYYDYVKVTVSLYDDPGRETEHLAVQDTAVLDFRYPVERRDDITAQEFHSSAAP